MITRAHIRRQLRASGGITNVMPREGYFLGSIVRGAKKAVGKVADVAKQVVKSPIGKAAILGLGASYLGPKIMSGGLGGLKSSLFGSIIPGVRAPGMPSFLGETGFTSTKGLLGKLGLTKGGGSMGITGLGKMLGAGGLIGYFTSKGSSEEEAKELAQDVYRGEGIGFDQIRKDIAAYRGGGLDASQMTGKGYRFLTPRNFVGAAGGRVGLKEGTVEPKFIGVDKAVKERPPENMLMEIAKVLFRLTPPGAAMFAGKKATEMYQNLNDEDKEKVQKFGKMALMGMGISGMAASAGMSLYDKFKNKKTQSGRVGLRSGGDPLPEDPTKPINPFGPKPTGPVLPNKMAEIPKGLSMQDAVKTFTLSNGRKPKSVQEVIEFFKNRKLSAMGGIMDMPTGNMRRNQAGVMERDYRDKGGFVPVGVKEKADDVPAMLSKNEFVMTADAVRGAGDGNIKKGAQRMYDLMKRNEGKVA